MKQQDITSTIHNIKQKQIRKEKKKERQKERGWSG
jgi:hypothetical protein